MSLTLQQLQNSLQAVQDIVNQDLSPAFSDFSQNSQYFNQLISTQTTLSQTLSTLLLSVQSNVLKGDQGIQGVKGDQGIQGVTGVGVSSIARTSGTGTSGSTDTYTITYTNNATSTFTVYNGADGSAGAGISFPVGSVFSFATLPSGFFECLGQAVDRSTYAALFNLIGTKYGSGDGSTTFNLPALYSDNLPIRRLNDFPIAIYGNALVTLQDGRVVSIGGNIAGNPSASVYIGTVSSDSVSWVSSTNYPLPIYSPTLSVLPDGRILVIGGTTALPSTYTNVCYIGTVSGNTILWALSTPLPLSNVSNHQATILSDGRILVSGGISVVSGSTVYSRGTYFGTISGNAVSWVSGTDIPVVLAYHSATLVNGNSLVLIGGYSGGWTSAVYVGLITGNTISWNVSQSLPTASSFASAVTLQDGRIMVFGGYDGTKAKNTIYVGILSGTNIVWSSFSSLPFVLYFFGSVLLNTGSFLLVGGYSSVSTSGTYIFNFLKRGIKW